MADRAKTMRDKFGDDYYQRLGAMGGKKKVTKGFGTNKKLASEAGRKGGLVSKRSKDETLQA